MSRIETVEVGGTEYTLGVDKDSTVTFTEAQTRTNIASGESLATMFGKIKKFFTDLKTVAFTGNVADMSDVTITSPASGDTLFHNGTGWENKNLMVEVTKAEYDALVANNEDDPNVDYHITDIDVAEAYYVETSGQTALTGATSLTFTNSHITPTSDIRILAEPASCKVSGSTQYKVSAKVSSISNGSATISFPALAENTEFWLLINNPLAIAQMEVPLSSYIGMVIQSTTLDTEEKVKAQYGGLTWIQHSGYVLRGATSGVTANSAIKDGGSDDAVVVSHSHNMAYRDIVNIQNSAGTQTYMTRRDMDNPNTSNTTTVKSTGESGTNKNIPNYKSVYIWERTA